MTILPVCWRHMNVASPDDRIWQLVSLPVGRFGHTMTYATAPSYRIEFSTCGEVAFCGFRTHVQVDFKTKTKYIWTRLRFHWRPFNCARHRVQSRAAWQCHEPGAGASTRRCPRKRRCRSDSVLRGRGFILSQFSGFDHSRTSCYSNGQKQSDANSFNSKTGASVHSCVRRRGPRTGHVVIGWWTARVQALRHCGEACHMMAAQRK